MEAERLKAVAKIKMAKGKKMALFSTNQDDYELAIEILDVIENIMENEGDSLNVNKEICHVLINYLDDAINYEVMDNLKNYGIVIANLAKYFEVDQMIEDVRYNTNETGITFNICLN
jgi:hypothetical protein